MKNLIVLLTLALSLAGCTVANVATQGFSSVPAGASVVIMPPDIKYYRITASGIPEPAPDWTATARNEFDTALGNYIQSSSWDVSFKDGDGLSATAIEYDKLHSAVGSTILANHFGLAKLPTKLDTATKQRAFDWSLGDGVSALAPEGDYALFVFYRDYQASGGRVGMAVFASLLGVAVYTGHQGGFASLVNLRTGDVVWFNNVAAATGNLRSADGAKSIVDQLFTGLNDPS